MMGNIIEKGFHLVRKLKHNGQQYIEFRCLVKVDGPGRYFIGPDAAYVTRDRHSYPEELSLVHSGNKLSIMIGEEDENGIYQNSKG